MSQATPTPGLRGDGRLTPLMLERFHAGVLSAEEQAAVHAHLAAHPEDRARLDALRAHADDFAARPVPAWLEATAAPPSAVVEAPALPQPANRSYLGVAALAATALIALSLSVPTAQPPQPDLRTKGSVLTVAFVRSTPTGPERLDPGDVVHPGDTLGVSLRSSTAGFLAVVGADGTGTVYPVLTPRPVKADEEARAAIELDDVPGQEWLVAVHCPTAIDAGALSSSLGEAARSRDPNLLKVPDGCARQLQVLHKGPDTP